MGGPAVYCVMKASTAGGGTKPGAAAAAGAGTDDLKQRLNRLKAAQAAAA